MADVVSSEKRAPSAEQASSGSRGERLGNWLRGLRGKANKPSTLVEAPPQPEPFQVTPKSIAEFLGVPEVEALPKSEKIFFHTTENKNLPGIRKTGLVQGPDDTNVGANLGYSLYFADEHQMRIGKRKVNDDIRLEPRRNTPADYSLVVFKDTRDLKKGKDDLSSSARFYQVNRAAQPGDAIEDFVEIKLGENPLRGMFPDQMLREVTREGVRVLPPNNIVAEVPLNSQVRDLVVMGMVMAESGTQTAQQIEAELVKAFSSPLPGLTTQTSTTELAHNMVASIEHDLIRATVLKKMAVLKQFETISRTPPQRLVEEALENTIAIRGLVNDPLSARLLDNSAVYLCKKLEVVGVDARTALTQARENVKQYKESSLGGKNPKNPISMEPGDYKAYYGSDSTALAAQSIRQELKAA